MSETYRLRMTASELKFLIMVLENMVETEEMIIESLGKKDHRLVEERRRRYVAKEMVRRFSGALKGNKFHMRKTALWFCDLLTKQAE